MSHRKNETVDHCEQHELCDVFPDSPSHTQGSWLARKLWVARLRVRRLLRRPPLPKCEHRTRYHMARHFSSLRGLKVVDKETVVVHCRSADFHQCQLLRGHPGDCRSDDFLWFRPLV